MGLGMFGGSSSCSVSTCFPAEPSANRKVVSPRFGNPNPKHFNLLRVEKVGRFVVVMAHYPDCYNYEGNKVLVFENADVSFIRNLASMDPHFCDSKLHLSPVARFEPTEKGWNYAMRFVETA